MVNVVIATTRATLEDARRIAVAEGRDEIALHLRRVGEEGRVDRSIVEARHRPGIETERARREDEIGALQARVAKGGGFGVRRIARKPTARVGVGEELRQMLVEFGIHRDDRGDRRSEENTSELQSLMRSS